jgi:NodT family efflux transporter outer membrane factor (OMF) lipoprotein
MSVSRVPLSASCCVRVQPWRAACIAAALLLTFLLLSGCALFLSEPPPSEIETPPRYINARPGGVEFLPAPDWWRAFGSNELTVLVERAIEANYDIAAAVARIEQADSQTLVSKTLFLPSGSLTGSRRVFRTSAASQDIDDITLPDLRLVRLGLTASYEVDFWGKNAALVKASQQTALASRFNRDVVELSIVVAVINTYLEVLAAQDRLRVAQQNLQLATRVRNIIQQRIDAGTSTMLDLAQQDYIVVQFRSFIPPLVKALEQSRVALATLIGETPDRVRVRGGSLDRLRTPVVMPGLPSELLLQRPDIREAESRLVAASANLASARVALLPSIKLTGERGFESTVLKTLFTSPAIVYDLATSLTQPIFDAPRLLAEVEVQKAVQKELLERYRQVIIKSFADVEQALIDVRESAREEALVRESVAVARRGNELSEGQLDAGNIDLTTMLNLQRTLFEAQNTLAQVRLTRFRAFVSLYQALGGGWKLEAMPNVVPLPPPRPEGAVLQ